MSANDDIVVRTAADLGTALRDARRRQDLTQDELAETAGVGRQQLIAIERGASTERLDRLFRLAHLLGLELVLRRRDPHRRTR